MVHYENDCVISFQWFCLQVKVNGLKGTVVRPSRIIGKSIANPHSPLLRAPDEPTGELQRTATAGSFQFEDAVDSENIHSFYHSILYKGMLLPKFT